MTKFVYTFASQNSLPAHAYLSISSLLNFHEAKDIVVFFTKPRSEEHIAAFERLNVDLRLVDTQTEEFAAFGSKQGYGEKTWLCSVEDDTVVFLDCDTIIMREITPVVEGDFQFKARPGTSNVREGAWKDLFDRLGRPYMNWMPNAGFLVFKEGIHRKIEADWKRFIGTDLHYRHKANHKEQYALALAVSEYKTAQMSPSEHVMLWNDEMVPDPVVVHIGKTFQTSSLMEDIKRNIAYGRYKLHRLLR